MFHVKVKIKSKAQARIEKQREIKRKLIKVENRQNAKMNSYFLLSRPFYFLHIRHVSFLSVAVRLFRS